jgi:O-antigen ligase
MSSIIILLAFLVGNKYSKTLNLFLIGIELFSLAITFSRGYWITTFLGVVASTFFMRGKARKRLLALMVGGGLLSAAVAFLLLPHIFGSLITGIIERAGSISPDALTIRSRLVESEAALGKFVRNPVIGYGMGALFTFYNILTNESLRTWYIHNAYVFLLFKFGIVGFIMFLSMYFKRVSELWELWKRKLETPDNSFVTALLLIPLMMLFISGTSPQFFDRGSLMILAIVWGIGESMLEGAA